MLCVKASSCLEARQIRRGKSSSVIVGIILGNSEKTRTYKRRGCTESSSYF
jgi:hypothetical protein